MLVIKQGFKFLNALGFSLKQQIVLFIGQGFQILRAIVAGDTIEVVNNPAFRQRFAVSLLPDKDMLKHIAPAISSRVVRFFDMHIAIFALKPSAFVRRVFFWWAFFHQFNRARLTYLGTITHRLSTLRTGLVFPMPINFGMCKTMTLSCISAFSRVTISHLHLMDMVLSTTGAKSLVGVCPTKNLSTVSTFNVHHLHKYNTIANQGQVVNE